MVAFYLDHHVPSAIAAGLRLRGVDVLTCQEDGTSALNDDLLLDRATSLNRVLFTQDQDLLAIAGRRQPTGVTFSGVVYAHQNDISIGQAILELIAKVMDLNEMANRVEYLPYS